jgi:hypothetical protein
MILEFLKKFGVHLIDVEVELDKNNFGCKKKIG